MSAEHEYLEVTVSRRQDAIVTLKVPKGWRPKGSAGGGVIAASIRSDKSLDWDNYGWESTLEVEQSRVVDEEFAKEYRVYDVHPHLRP